MNRLLCAALVAISLVVVPGASPVVGESDPPGPSDRGGVPDIGQTDIGAAIASGRHLTDHGPPAPTRLQAPDGFARVPIERRHRNGLLRSSTGGGRIALSVYVVAPIRGRVAAGQVLPMHHVGATTLVERADFFDVDLGRLETLVDAALTRPQRAIYRNGIDRYEFRFMASTERAIGLVAVRGGRRGHLVAVEGSNLLPAGPPPLVLISDGGGADRNASRSPEAARTHDPARTICSSAFGSAFWPAGLQVRDTFTSDDRAELTYVKTSPTSVARVRYSSSDRTSVDVGVALWGINLDASTQKSVARELAHTYTTTTGPNQYRAITTTLYARQFLLRCMIPNPFGATIQLTRPHQYAEYHAEAAEGLVPRGRTPHGWLAACRNQFKTQIGSRNSGGTWSQHRSLDLTYQNAVRLRPGGVRAFLQMDLRQRIGRTDEITVSYEKVHRGRLTMCGFNFKIPSQSSRVRAQGACNPKPCEPVLY